MCVAHLQQTVFEVVMKVVRLQAVRPAAAVEPGVLLLVSGPTSGQRFQVIEGAFVAVMDLGAALTEA
jgi:hypothetical protein